MPFGEIFRKAIRIAWKHKILWIPVIVVTLITAIYSLLSTLLTSAMTLPSNNASVTLLPILLLFFELAFVVFTSFAGTAQYQIVNWGILQSEKGMEKPSLRHLWQESRKYFWRIFGIITVLSLGLSISILPFACIIGIVLGRSMFSSTSNALSPNILTTPVIITAVCFLIPFFCMVMGIIELCIMAAIVDNRSFGDSLGKGFKLFFKHFGWVLLASIVFGLIQYTIAGSAGWGFTALTQHFTSLLINGNGGSLPIGLAWFFSLPVYMIAASIMFVFTQAVWQQIYRRFSGQTPPEGIVTPQANA